MKKLIFLILPVFLISVFSACSMKTKPYEPADFSEENVAGSASDYITEEVKPVKMNITAGGKSFTAVPENNSSAKAFPELLEKGPLTIQMSDYGGMEKVGSLGTTLPRNDSYITAKAGDVILYQGNQITIYYDINSWNFTKLVLIENTDKESLLNALGDGDITVTFSAENN